MAAGEGGALVPLGDLQVAIVHDYLNQRGGAERVVLELSRMWPAAPIYTSLYRPESTFPEFRGRQIRTTPLDLIPVDRGFRNLLPLYPAAFRMLGAIEADAVIASSSGWAHMARAAPGTLRVVYCHTPARWLYGGGHLNGRGAQRLLAGAARPLFRSLRAADRAAAHRTDLYVANSQTVRARIRRVYGIDAPVVHPPVDVARFAPRPPGERLLVVSRLLPYKHVELVVRAANRLGVGLDVVGEGPMLGELRQLAGPTVALHGAVDDAQLVELMERCRAVCVAAEEDFGLVAVEAQAAGKTVIAYGRGGALETVEEGVSGVFFHERSVESLIEAIRACERLDTAPEVLARRAGRFSSGAFRVRMARVLAEALARRSASGGETALQLPAALSEVGDW